MTDVRKAVTTSDVSRPKRPQTLSRKSTNTVLKLGKNPRDREREWEEERSWEDERESFPQYCMTCEKQFIPQDEKFLYCSEECRKHDQHISARTTQSAVAAAYAHASMRSPDGFSGTQPFYSAGNPEPRDIIPRASPSRPSSNYWSPPTTPTTSSHYTSAISALRSLSIRPPSPPSPVSANSSIWPFARSAATSPSTSYTKQPDFYSSTYDGGYATSGYGYSTGGMNSDRPLPTRKPNAYARPKSVELVTPMVSR
ncbi:Uu.00g058080.m01.CDS01 [Anthostomella pinea]|uniref:Uu.00g058080.m01.CDS01 n=1 Tax=Anthostomella pinea TaxID=933095 RepID=A0AAI8VRV2_9PEZI|nr:Uu.00g058080.m01.CDS01 [Anthostomella pinea]